MIEATRVPVADWPDDHLDLAKAIIRDNLRRGAILVRFTKKDGTTRDMTCTLNEDLIKQADAEPKGESTKTEKVQPVLDIEKNEWRSFRWDSVIEAIIE